MTTLQSYVPKIIHQTGPSDESKWHPLWKKCQWSWKEAYTDFEYRFWSDDQIDELISSQYPQFKDMYEKFPVHIMKIDFVRFAILHSVGGIYADLDVFCYQNFYDELTESAYIVENPYGNDPFENSLMCGISGSEFFMKCMELSLERWEYAHKKAPEMIKKVSEISTDRDMGLFVRPYLVFFITGTQLLSSAYRKYSDLTGTLPGVIFNNKDMSYDIAYRTKHVHTGVWGKENIEIASEIDGAYKNLRNIPVDQFDFYTDYTNGNYLKTNSLDIYKNDNEPLPVIGISYGYS
jgi:mannosyltransferase OCH1-like enzyme